MAKDPFSDDMVGKEAPDFSLPSTTGQCTLSDFRGQTVILYFYPRDNTPGCTMEACDFRDEIPQFQKLDTIVIGISTDSVARHEKFTAKYQLPFTLAADVDGSVSREYGVYKEKSLYGKLHLGIERSTFVIDDNGIVRAAFRKVKVSGHVAAVQSFVAKELVHG